MFIEFDPLLTLDQIEYNIDQLSLILQSQQEQIALLIDHVMKQDELLMQIVAKINKE